MDRTVAISSGWFLVGALLTYILLSGSTKRVGIEVIPQGESKADEDYEDEKVSRLDFRKSKQA